MALFPLIFSLARSLFAPRLELMVEILALRQQLAILNRTTKRPSLRFQDRLFWATLLRFWRDWRSAPLIVKLEAVIKWHRQGFRLYWRWKSKAGRPGRPRIDAEIRELIRRLSRENPLWGTPRIQSELSLLRFEVAESTVAKYRIKTPKPSSQTWKTFLSNHARDIIGADFFTVPTATFRNLYCFIILSHVRRQVVHFNVTEHPTAAWTAQQMIEAFPEDSAPRFLLRDRDSIYGHDFQRRVAGMRTEEVTTAPHSPWQNSYAERLIGSIRRECLDHVIIFSEEHLRRILKRYFLFGWSASNLPRRCKSLRLRPRRAQSRSAPSQGLRGS
jgi:putative transposase